MGSYTQQQLEEFLSSRDIAVIGASPNNQWFGNILENALLTMRQSWLIMRSSRAVNHGGNDVQQNFL